VPQIPKRAVQDSQGFTGSSCAYHASLDPHSPRRSPRTTRLDTLLASAFMALSLCYEIPASCRTRRQPRGHGGWCYRRRPQRSGRRGTATCPRATAARKPSGIGARRGGARGHRRRGTRRGTPRTRPAPPRPTAASPTESAAASRPSSSTPHAAPPPRTTSTSSPRRRSRGI
jgi:hypothetical protein